MDCINQLQEYMSFKRNKKNAWAIALEKVLAEAVDEVPEGWLNTYGIAKEMGLSEEQAGKAVTILKQKGKVEVRKFRVKSNGKTGIIKKICYYRLISEPSKKTSRAQGS